MCQMRRATLVDDCEKLEARAAMLHEEATLGLARAAEEGSDWPGFDDQVAIATRVQEMAATVEEKIDQQC